MKKRNAPKKRAKAKKPDLSVRLASMVTREEFAAEVAAIYKEMRGRLGGALEEIRMVQRDMQRGAPKSLVSDAARREMSELDERLNVDETVNSAPCASATYKALMAARAEQRKRE